MIIKNCINQIFSCFKNKKKNIDKSLTQIEFGFVNHNDFKKSDNEV